MVWPWARRLTPHQRVAVFIGPQMSRVLGWGLMVPNLSPGMPEEFYVPTVIGDTTTAVLALVSFVLLMRRHALGFAVAWLVTIVGVLDGLHAMTTAAQLNVAGNLAAQWFVPAINMPLMFVCHTCAVIALWTRRDSTS